MKTLKAIIILIILVQGQISFAQLDNSTNIIDRFGYMGLSPVRSEFGPFELNGDNETIGYHEAASVSKLHIDLEERIVFDDENQTAQNSHFHSPHVIGCGSANGNLDELLAGIAAQSNIHNSGPMGSMDETFITDNPTLRIHQHSYLPQGYGANYTNLSSERDALIFMYPELLDVHGGGNSESNDDYSLASGPNTAKNVLTVGASHIRKRGNPLRYNAEVRNDYRRGPTTDGRLKPEIIAQYNVYSQDLANSYRPAHGTSEANPMVAAAGALLAQKYKEEHAGAEPLGGLLKAILCNTASDIEAPGPDYKSGFGVLNINRAVKALDEGRYFGDHVNIQEVEEGSVEVFDIEIPEDVNIAKVLLYWVDPAAEANCTDCLVNNLELTVTDANGNINYPLILNPIFPTEDAVPADYTAGSRDLKNNIKQVTLIDPEPGTYSIAVGGYVVQEGMQSFHISYEFFKDEIEIVHPYKGDKLISDAGGNVISWDCYSAAAQTFKIEYSTDGGQSYTTLDDAYTVEPHEVMVFPWTAAVENSGTAKVKISRTSGDQISTETENFTISNRLKIIEDELYLEDGKVSLSWLPIENAVNYEILKYALGLGEPEVIASTTDNQFTINTLNNTLMNWISVRPVFEGNKVGVRSISKRVIEERIYVSEFSSSITPDGKSWATAYTNLGDAIFYSPAKEYWISEGAYSGFGIHVFSFDTKLIGGFPSTGNPALEDRNPKKYVTTFLAQYAGSNSSFRDWYGYNDALLYSERDFTVDGIFFTTNSNESSARNYISHNSRKSGGVLNVFNCTLDNTVNNSSIHSINTGTNGLQVHIDNCLFARHYYDFDNAPSIIIDDKFDPNNPNFTNVLLTNSSFEVTSPPNIIEYNAFNPASSLDIYNTVFYGANHVGIGEGSLGPNVTIDYCYINNDAGDFNYGSNNIISPDDPFNNVPAIPADYTPKPNSPIIDAGSNEYLSLKDMNWIDRPIGGVTDMGAFEYTAGSTIIYVHDQAIGSKDGSSWTNAYTSLRQAVNSVPDDCVSKTEIWVAEGTYFASDNGNRNQRLTLEDCTALYGGFPDPLNSGISNPTHLDRNPITFISMLSGDINLIGNSNDNTKKIIEVQNIDAYAIINGFTIEDCYNDAIQAPVLFRSSDVYSFEVFFRNMKLSNNLGYNGAALAIVGSSNGALNFNGNNVSIVDNIAAANGGAIYIKGIQSSILNVNLQSSLLKNNYSDRFGGAIYHASNTASIVNLNLENVQIENNQSFKDGGALYSFAQASGSENNFSLSDVKFWNNSTLNNHGGAISSRTKNFAHTNIAVTQSEFVGNEGDRGGVVYSSAFDFGESSISISKTIIKENTARDVAATLYIQTGLDGLHNTSLSNCLSVNNINGTDPGIILYTPDSHPNFGTSNLDIFNSTFYQASNQILKASDNSSTYNTTNSNYIFIKNSILVNDFGDAIYQWSRGEIELENSIISNPFCNIPLSTCTNVQFNTDPLFVNVDSDNFELQESSTGIDAGIVLLDVMDDLLGIPRPIGTAHDIGCYEFTFAQESDEEPMERRAPIEKVDIEAVQLNTKIYPNPSSGRFTIELTNELNHFDRIDVVDLNGRIVYSEEIANKSKRIEVNLQDQLLTGIYFVRSQFDNGTILTKKVQLNSAF